MINDWVWLGCLLGAASSAYVYLPEQPLGFAFPNINGELSVRPTMGRVAAFLLGRWVGNLALALIMGWLSVWLSGPLALRLVFSASALFSVFLLLLALGANSPELDLARWTDPSKLSLPTPILGFLAAGLFVSTTIMALLISLGCSDPIQRFIFFSNFFLGNTLLTLPLLLNIKVSKAPVFQGIVRLIAGGCAVLVFARSIVNLLKL